jgi:phosphoribosyl-AMP cyclohydrolase / phosphoribosyl-ATP pyrophosphohydrolase
MNLSLDIERLSFDKERGTVVVVAQDAGSGRVLMVANADREALERTIETGEMHYRSRSRGLWRKGATSGNVQKVVSLTADCDSDTVLARVVSAGPACHTGAVSCFDASAMPNVWSALAATIAARNTQLKEDSTTEGESASREQSRSYTWKLLLDRNLRLKKIGEESAELIAACADGDARRSAEEAADLIYHVAVALEAIGTSLDSVAEVLLERSIGTRLASRTEGSPG